MKKLSEIFKNHHNEVEHHQNVDSIMRKFDRESNTRVWTGWRKTLITYISAFFSLYCIWSTLFSTALPEVRLTRFLAFIIILGYLHYPHKKGYAHENKMPIFDIVLMILGAAAFLYFTFNALAIIEVAHRISKLQIAIGIVGILVLLELTRRCVGLPILFVLGALLIYTFINQASYLGSFYMTLRSIIYKLFYTTNGVIGTPVSVCYTYIVLFILFGTFLSKTSIADLFIAFANKLTGKSAGGPAKVAVISSALCGMVSGSSVGNTVTTGSVTIPMMKETGYKPEFAGAVEAASSTGGQIMPPILGAAAFLMAEYMGVPYSQVALKAILPALLYFIGIFIPVHLEAKRLGLKGVSEDKLIKWSEILKNCYLFIPLVVLIVLVSTGQRTMQFSAAVSIGLCVIVGFINPKNRLNLKKIIETLESGAKGAITVSVACAVAGLVAGCITVTGLASTLINAIVSVSGNFKMIGLLLTMICCIILGMGVPTTANYCIMASTCAPILIQLGIDRIAAHFFVFYFGIVADITPPVALAAYAGSAIAKASPIKTGFTATRLAIAAFIVPFVFAYNPTLLFVGVTHWFQIVQIIITSLFGIYGVSAALEGYVSKQNNIFERILYLLGGLTLIIPETVTDIVGLLVLIALTVYDFLISKRRHA